MNQSSPVEPRHLPVMPAEVLHYLAPAPGQTVVDATLGAAGHALLIARQLGNSGKLIGLDRDQAMLAVAEAQLKEYSATLVPANFGMLREVLDEQGIDRVDAVLADLGICSAQLDDPERGFSFQQPGPLDMRMNPDYGEPAGNLLRRLREKELADLFYHLGEERFSRRIARRIVETRRVTPLETTDQLANLIRRCVPRPKGQGQRIDPATRVFQALRIAVNDELAALERLLALLPDCLKPGGRAVILSFHSLEDRKVKQAFAGKEQWDVLTRKPVQAGEAEVQSNPRSRSAKLRAASVK